MWSLPKQSATELIPLESIVFRIFRLPAGSMAIRPKGHLFCFTRRATTIVQGFGREPHEKIHSARGDYGLIPAGTEYRAEFLGPVESVSIEAPPELFDSIAYETVPPERGAMPLVKVARDTIMDQAGHLVEAIAMTPPEERCGLVVDQLVLGMAARAMQRAGVDPMRGDAPYRNGLPPMQLWRVREYIEANYATPLTVRELAGVACLSVFHFTRAFGISMGMSPMRYVWRCRVERAKDAIRRPHAPSLAIIALDCGFRSQTHFCEAFKRETGMTPGAFRRVHRGAVAVAAALALFLLDMLIPDQLWLGLLQHAGAVAMR